MRLLSRAAAAAVAALVLAPLPPLAAQSAAGNGAAPVEATRTPRLGHPLFFGPLTTEEAGPLQRVSFNHTVEGADLIPTGTVQAQFWMGYSNIFEQDSAATHELFLDMERLAQHTGVRWGVSDRLEVGGRLSFETTNGGFLDPILTAWHGKLGVGNANRGKYPHSVYALRLRSGDSQVPLPAGPRGMALADVRLFAKWLAWRSADGGRLISVRGVTWFPTQDGFGGERRADVSLMALGRASWTRWHLHGTVGGATVRAARDGDGLLRSRAFFLDVAAERVLAPWVSGVVQLSAASPRFQGFDHPEVDGWPVNFVFGVTGMLGDGWRVDVSFQEDIPPNTPAVDFTLGIGVRKNW